MKSHIIESLAVRERILSDENFLKNLSEITESIKDVYRRGGKLLIAGNGGSAADAQHFAAEITCQYKATRKGYPAIALHTDTSALTAWGNDKSFETFFSRQVEALGTTGDALMVISTSGNSKNILSALETAKTMGIQTFALLGRDGGSVKRNGLSDLMIVVPSEDTPHIQESHIMIIHMICEELDAFFLAQDSRGDLVH